MVSRSRGAEGLAGQRGGRAGMGRGVAPRLAALEPVAVTSSMPNPAGGNLKRHERLQAWCACHEMALAVYHHSRAWPASERYGLTSQVRRAAYSAAANIAEGAAKRGPQEFRRHLDVALGSLPEIDYALRLARDLGYLPPERWGELEVLRDHAGRLTWGLYRAIRSTTVSP